MKPYGEWLANIVFTKELDGGGRLLAPFFAEALAGQKFKRCFEWCAGPAWIGFWLLELGIIGELVTGDINPAAVVAVKKTGGATAYLSDNMRSIPSDESFDIVVGNPPNYCDIQPAHTFGHLRRDLRPSDIGWKVHREFYATIGPHLEPGAELWVSEVEPFAEEILFGGEVYDRRPRAPIIDFVDMMAAGGLRLEKIVPFKYGTHRMALLKSRMI